MGVGRAGLSPARIADRHPGLQEMVIANLQPETAYSITVAAYTMKGDGARSKPKVVVTKGAGRRLPHRSPVAPRASHGVLELTQGESTRQPGQ